LTVDSPVKKNMEIKKKENLKINSVPSVLSSGEDGDDSRRQSITATRFRPYSSRSSSSELTSLSFIS
jgi:hypothetical protein